ncbi:MAG: dephospho-CoA kinase [Pseudomonadota bacterium]
MTFVLGLTGSIGMGKSTTAMMFKDAGVPVWDADAVVHKLYAKGGDAVEPVKAAFPAAFRHGSIDRDVLKSLLSKDKTAIKTLETIVHPLVTADRAGFLAEQIHPLVVCDIPLLFETGADAWLDGVLVVTASAMLQRARVMARPGMTEQQFELLLARQMPDAEKRRRADYVIETLTFEDTKKAVQSLIEKLTGEPNA